MENKNLREVYDKLESTWGDFASFRDALDYLQMCGNSGMTERQYDGIIRMLLSTLKSLCSDFGIEVDELFKFTKISKEDVA